MREQGIHLSNLVDRRVRGLSERKLYDFFEYGKSINSDALEVIFHKLGLEVVPTTEASRRDEARKIRGEKRHHLLELRQQRMDAASAESKAIMRVVDAKMYYHYKAGWHRSKATPNESRHDWEGRTREEYTLNVKSMTDVEREKAVEKWRIAAKAL